MMRRFAAHVCAHRERLWWTTFVVLGFVFALPPSIAVALGQ